MELLNVTSGILGSNPCVCQDQWDASDFRDSCANQQGCTDCAAEGRKWCFPTDPQCDVVERNTDGASENWFWCEVEIIASSTPGISSESKRVYICVHLNRRISFQGLKIHLNYIHI